MLLLQVSGSIISGVNLGGQFSFFKKYFVVFMIMIMICIFMYLIVFDCYVDVSYGIFIFAEQKNGRKCWNGTYWREL